jgi:hypothetical protein
MGLLVTLHMVLLATPHMGFVPTFPIFPRPQEGAMPPRLLLLAPVQHAQLDGPNRRLCAV